MPELAASAGVRLEQAYNDLPMMSSKDMPSSRPLGFDVHGKDMRIVR